MDIDLLSKMVKELILDNDKVALPGLGCFVAEIVPSTFSDKGYTINPPYRRLSFRSRPDDGDMLVRFYATSNGVNMEVARRIIVDFVGELKAVLHSRKMVVFPGLGRLRATKENNVFFVADENLDIYPSGFGLYPVSLKNHNETKEEVAAAVEGLASILSSDQVKQIDVQSVAESRAIADVDSANVVKVANEESKEELVPAVEPVHERESVPESAREPEPEASPESSPESTPKAPESAPATLVTSNEAPESTPKASPESRKAWVIIGIIVGVLIVLLLLFMLMGRVAPNIIDKLLYSAEDLEILYYQFR